MKKTHAFHDLIMDPRLDHLKNPTIDVVCMIDLLEI